MVKCCAIGCRNPGTHIFPKDTNVRILWEKAVNRKNFKSTKHSRLCSQHFTNEDYIAEGFYTGLRHERKILRKGVVPTSFIKLEKKNCNKVKRQPNASNTGSALNSNNSNKSEVNFLHVEKGSQKLNQCSIGTQKFLDFFSVDAFKDDNDRIYFYTGLKTYDLFIKVFRSLGPEAHSLCYKRNQDLDMLPKDQFLLTLTKLKRDKDDYELAFFFNVQQNSIADIVSTWVNFIYIKWNDKYEINDQMHNTLPEGGDSMVINVLDVPNSLIQNKIKNKSMIQCNDFENLGNMFFIINSKRDKIYTVLMPKILFICKILNYFSKDILLS